MYLNHIMRGNGSSNSKGIHTNEISNLTLRYSFTDKEDYASPCSWMSTPRCPRANITNDNGERTADLR